MNHFRKPRSADQDTSFYDGSLTQYGFHRRMSFSLDYTAIVTEEDYGIDLDLKKPKPVFRGPVTESMVIGSSKIIGNSKRRPLDPLENLPKSLPLLNKRLAEKRVLSDILHWWASFVVAFNCHFV